MGCKDKSTEPNSVQQAEKPRSKITNPQQQKPRKIREICPNSSPYRLPEYKLDKHDEVFGLGGIWESQRYALKPGYKVDPEKIRSRIKTALKNRGWIPAPLHSRKYETRLF